MAKGCENEPALYCEDCAHERYQDGYEDGKGAGIRSVMEDVAYQVNELKIRWRRDLAFLADAGRLPPKTEEMIDRLFEQLDAALERAAI